MENTNIISKHKPRHSASHDLLIHALTSGLLPDLKAVITIDAENQSNQQYLNDLYVDTRDSYAGASLTQFPHCCGILLASNFRSSDYFEYIPKHNLNLARLMLFEILMEVAKLTKYTSLMFVYSSEILGYEDVIRYLEKTQRIKKIQETMNPNSDRLLEVFVAEDLEKYTFRTAKQIQDEYEESLVEEFKEK